MFDFTIRNFRAAPQNRVGTVTQEATFLAWSFLVYSYGLILMWCDCLCTYLKPFSKFLNVCIVANIEISLKSFGQISLVVNKKSTWMCYIPNYQNCYLNMKWKDFESKKWSLLVSIIECGITYCVIFQKQWQSSILFHFSTRQQLWQNLQNVKYIEVSKVTIKELRIIGLCCFFLILTV